MESTANESIGGCLEIGAYIFTIALHFPSVPESKGIHRPIDLVCGVDTRSRKCSWLGESRVEGVDESRFKEVRIEVRTNMNHGVGVASLRDGGKIAGSKSPYKSDVFEIDTLHLDEWMY
jgi:hypothetical protein